MEAVPVCAARSLRLCRARRPQADSASSVLNTCGTAIAGVPPMNTFFSKFQIIAGGFSVGAGNVAILVLVCIMVAETVATFAWFLKWMGYCLPGEPSEEVAAGAPLPRAMAFVFIVLIIMVIVSGPLSASWIG